MKKLCVFCGSSEGKSPKYIANAKELGKEMASKKIGLVYGGASIGVMGAVADSVLENGGEAYGIIPESIVDLEISHEGLTDLQVVDTMHTRKNAMYEMSDYFVAIPGGMGTLDELCEIVTWAQLEYHTKPVYVLNQEGFYDSLLAHFRHINKEGFLSDDHLALVNEVKTIEELLGKLEA